MIKFYRKIRQNLIMENNTSKYFKYAIGEIVLVVIGILIALQINNWNEKQKLDSKTQEYYVQLLEDLNKDIVFANQIIAKFENYLKELTTYTSSYNEALILTPDEAYKQIANLGAFFFGFSLSVRVINPNSFFIKLISSNNFLSNSSDDSSSLETNFKNLSF